MLGMCFLPGGAGPSTISYRRELVGARGVLKIIAAEVMIGG